MCREGGEEGGQEGKRGGGGAGGLSFICSKRWTWPMKREWREGEWVNKKKCDVWRRRRSSVGGVGRRLPSAPRIPHLKDNLTWRTSTEHFFELTVFFFLIPFSMYVFALHAVNKQRVCPLLGKGGPDRSHSAFKTLSEWLVSRLELRNGNKSSDKM